MKAQAEQAEQTRRDADALKQQYEARLTDWQRERDAKAQALNAELVQERNRQLELLQKTLADEHAKTASREQAAQSSREQVLLRQARTQALGETADLLGRLADPALTSRIVAILLEDLQTLPEVRQNELRQAAARLGSDECPHIASAHALDTAQVERIEQAIRRISGHDTRFQVSTDPALIAGLRITLGECVLHANLADELGYFYRT